MYVHNSMFVMFQILWNCSLKCTHAKSLFEYSASFIPLIKHNIPTAKYAVKFHRHLEGEFEIKRSKAL